MFILIIFLQYRMYNVQNQCMLSTYSQRFHKYNRFFQKQYQYNNHYIRNYFNNNPLVYNDQNHHSSNNQHMLLYHRLILHYKSIPRNNIINLHLIQILIHNQCIKQFQMNQCKVYKNKQIHYNNDNNNHWDQLYRLFSHQDIHLRIRQIMNVQLYLFHHHLIYLMLCMQHNTKLLIWRHSLYMLFNSSNHRFKHNHYELQRVLLLMLNFNELLNNKAHNKYIKQLKEQEQYHDSKLSIMNSQ